MLCVCEAEARLARSVGAGRRVRVVHNGVEPLTGGVAHPAVEELRRAGPVIGVLTLLRPGKGVETLIDALPAVVARHPDVRVAIAGDGPDRAFLERRIVEQGLSEVVYLLGRVEGPGPLLRGCDVFCSPSWAESLPLSLLEAMTEGLPIVATAVGGCAEAVEDGRSGLLVEPRNASALAVALTRVLEDRGFAGSMGSAAREIALERFTFDRMVEGTLSVYGGAAV